MSVLIPTCGRPHRLSACLSGLARQTLPRERYEVLIGIDGPEEGELAAVGSAPSNVSLLSFPKGGMAATRNRLIEQARGKYLLFLSDCAVPEEKLLETHLIDQALAVQAGKPTMIMGATPWVAYTPERLFDRLVREKGLMWGGRMIPQDGGGRAMDYDWGYSYAWSVNLSVPLEPVRRLGGYSRQLTRAEYDDLELAWRLQRWLNLPLRFNPEAVVRFDRRHDPLDLIRREALLGYESIQLAVLSPQCAKEYFARDVGCPNDARYSKGFVSRERMDAEAAFWNFLSLASLPTASMTKDQVDSRLSTAAQCADAVQKFLWRRGHLCAANHEAMSQLGEAVDEFITTASKRRGKIAA